MSRDKTDNANNMEMTDVSGQRLKSKIQSHIRAFNQTSEEYENMETVKPKEAPKPIWTFDVKSNTYRFVMQSERVNRGWTHTFEQKDVEGFIEGLNDNRWESHFQLMDGSFVVETAEQKPDVVVVKEHTPVTVPAGIYEFVEPEKHGDLPYLSPYSFSTDEYIPLNDHTGEILNDIETFLASKDKYKKLGLLHKRGMLLYGPPGTGKTMLLENVSRSLSDRARVIFLNPRWGVGFLKAFKDSFSDMPTILIFEEFTQGSQDADILSFLDGETSWDNTIFIGTTNYPERIPSNLIDRPARIDSMFELGLPSEATRRKYLESKLGSVTQKTIDATAKYTIAYLKELVVATQIYDMEVHEIIEKFESRKAKIAEFIKQNEDARKIVLVNPSQNSKYGF